MPDISLIRQISKDFNISLDELFDGEYKKTIIKKGFVYFYFYFCFIYFNFLLFVFFKIIK